MAIRNSPAIRVSGAEGIVAQLDRILASKVFARSDRLTRFLRFSVEQALAGNGDRLKEQTIGIEVFDRKPDYDPRIDPIVRVEARRLRAKLEAYYASPGRADSVLIGLPKGAYAPLFQSRTRTAPQSEPAEKSIVVLPFANLTPDAGDDYFSDGLTEELIHLLTRIPRLRVMAWNSASQLRGREQDFAGIREQLKVGAVLRGSVRRTPGRVRVTAQLIGTDSGAYLWSEVYDRQIEDVFAIQEEMARAIVDTLQLALTSLHSRGVSHTAQGLACYNLCLQGRFHANQRTTEGLRKSVQCFEQAIAIDDSSAVAHSGLADAYSLLADYGLVNSTEAIPKARSAAEKALTLDPQSSEANVSLAFIRSMFDWDWAGAEVLYRRAIAFNPGYSRARHWFGVDHLALLGRFDEALSEAQMAIHLDPLSPIIREGCGYVHMLSRDYPGALAIHRQTLDLDPTFYKGYSSLGRVLYQMERYDDAVEAFQKALALGGLLPSTLGALGQALGSAGRVAEARAVLDQLQAMAQTRWIPSSCVAILYLGLRDYQSSLTWLESACDGHELAVTSLKVHPVYDPLRSEPRFNRLLERIGLLP